MSAVKSTLTFSATVLRLTSKGVANWPWVLAIACIASPISPHISTGLLSGDRCAYLGTRGAVKAVPSNLCTPVAIINTETGQIITWETLSW